MFRSTVFTLTDSSSSLRLIDAEYDSGTGDFFSLGNIDSPHYSHFISRMDYKAELVWGRAYNTSNTYLSSWFTLQYSPTYQTLHYTLFTDPMALVRANSTNGDILSTYQVPQVSYNSWWHTRCSLSTDELAYY